MTKSSPTFDIISFGCKVNRVESDTFAARLIDLGYHRSGPESRADVLIVNTCTVTAEADAKVRKSIHRILRSSPNSKLIVTGCSAAIDPGVYSNMDENIIVEPDKMRIVQLACSILGPTLCFQEQRVATEFRRIGPGFMSRAGIKIQDGCKNACTYCIVHVARGPLWSKPKAEVVSEVSAAEKAGVCEVVLTGVNIGAYPDLAGLLEHILEQTSSIRIRISSIEPLDVSDSLIKLMAASHGRICRHLHMPLQSGCDKTLNQMARPYDTETYRELCERMKSIIPNISLSTDVIAGFPGETEEDFKKSLEFCKDIGFSKMHIFRYSARPNTPAASRNDQVPANIKSNRARQLRDLSREMRETFAKGLVGSKEQVVLESGGEATSESYFRAAKADGSAFDYVDRSFSRLDVLVTGVKGDLLLCETLSPSNG